MSWNAVDPQARAIGEPVQQALFEKYRKRAKVNEEIERSLVWRPTLHLETRESLIVAAEVMSTPFPEVLQITKLNILNAHLPVIAYSICPEAAYLTAEGQRQARILQANGLGLFTVDDRGLVTEHFGAIPLIQHIPTAEMKALLQTTNMPAWLKQLTLEAYNSYCTKAKTGIADVSAILEGMVNNAVSEGINKTWLPATCAGGMLASSLDAMARSPQFSSALPSIGGARSFTRNFRNPVSHAPRSRAQAYKHFMQQKTGFFSAIQLIDGFYSEMKAIGIRVR